MEKKERQTDRQTETERETERQREEPTLTSMGRIISVGLLFGLGGVLRPLLLLPRIRVVRLI